MKALINELVIRWVDNRLEIRSNTSRHLAEGSGVARLWWCFYFVLQQGLSFRARLHLCRQGGALARTEQLRSQGPVPVYAHSAERVTRLEALEGVNGDGNGVGDGVGNGNGGEDKRRNGRR